MDMFFAEYSGEHCCLCGSSERLTGEHKVKASALRGIFGDSSMVIGKFDGISRPRPAQGPKSRAFHFLAPVCAACNSSRTQAADREFDRFHLLMSEALMCGDTPESVFNLSEYAIDSERYLNVFRYFAKLLCCHIAESGGPRPFDVSEFAIGEIDRNVILLRIDTDPMYSLYNEKYGETRFASHGGLLVPLDADTELPTSFESSASFGPIRYSFSVQFGPAIGVELQTFHHEFWLKCQAAYHVALKNSVQEE